MTATMIRIERSEKMAKAIVRCKGIRPMMRRIDAQTIKVTSPRGSYTVRIIRPRPDLV